MLRRRKGWLDQHKGCALSAFRSCSTARNCSRSTIFALSSACRAGRRQCANCSNGDWRPKGFCRRRLVQNHPSTASSAKHLRDANNRWSAQSRRSRAFPSPSSIRAKAPGRLSPGPSSLFRSLGGSIETTGSNRANAAPVPRREPLSGTRWKRAGVTRVSPALRAHPCECARPSSGIRSSAGG
jgi:hypothetical protein